MESRIQHAVHLFKEGYNCSQSVVAAFADLYDLDEQIALRMSCSFGGGIGRMRQTCGAACGMFLLAGLDNGTTEGSDASGKKENYALVQKLADEFKNAHGSLICAELLALPKASSHHEVTPEERTEGYYQRRPCVRIVEEAARIYAKHLSEQTT